MSEMMTKKELQALVDEIGERVSNMLDPVLTREEIVEQMKELDGLVNGSEEDDEDDELVDEDEDSAE